VFLAQKRSGRPQWKTDLLNQGVGVARELSEKLGCETVDGNWYGLNFYRVVQLGSRRASGIISDDSETI
jgi:hypothetical protein